MSAAGHVPRSTSSGAAAGPFAGLVPLAAWPPLRIAFGATIALVGVTCLALGAVAPRLVAPGGTAFDPLLGSAGVTGAVALVVVVLGGPVAAVLGGAIGAGTPAGGRPDHGPSGAARGSRIRSLAALAGLLLPGVAAAVAIGLATVGAGSWLGAGSSAASGLDIAQPATGEMLGAILRSWGAVAALAALGWAAGAISGRRSGGLAALGCLLAAELFLATLDPASPLLTVAPLTRLAGLVGAGIDPLGMLALALGASALLVGLAVVATRDRRANHPAG